MCDASELLDYTDGMQMSNIPHNFYLRNLHCVSVASVYEEGRIEESFYYWPLNLTSSGGDVPLSL